MENEKKKDEIKTVVAEYNVSMHCNACERSVAKAISKFKGVEEFTTDMNKHKVTVKGKIDPEKLLKKVKKKTGKRVEIVPKNNEKEEGTKDSSGGEEQELLGGEDPPKQDSDSPLFECWKDNEVLMMMFSDENPNACSIM